MLNQSKQQHLQITNTNNNLKLIRVDKQEVTTSQQDILVEKQEGWLVS